jgi:hypothetical protein
MDDVGNRLVRKLGLKQTPGKGPINEFAKRTRELQNEGHTVDQAAIMAATEKFRAEFESAHYAYQGEPMETLLTDIEKVLSAMFWTSIVKGTGSIWSVMFSILVIIAFVWFIALNRSNPILRWSIAGIGTIVALGSPGGLACLYWIFSPEFRKQHRAYRRGEPPPGA